MRLRFRGHIHISPARGRHGLFPRIGAGGAGDADSWCWRVEAKRGGDAGYGHRTALATQALHRARQRTSNSARDTGPTQGTAD